MFLYGLVEHNIYITVSFAQHITALIAGLNPVCIGSSVVILHSDISFSYNWAGIAIFSLLLVNLKRVSKSTLIF